MPLSLPQMLAALIIDLEDIETYNEKIFCPDMTLEIKTFSLTEVLYWPFIYVIGY
jgi:hypothetical protein